jgi:hypothetical protein
MKKMKKFYGIYGVSSKDPICSLWKLRRRRETERDRKHISMNDD